VFSGFLCCVGGLVSLEFVALFKVVNLKVVQVLFLSLVVNFQFFGSHIPVTTFGLDLFSGAYIHKLCV